MTMYMINDPKEFVYSWAMILATHGKDYRLVDPERAIDSLWAYYEDLKASPQPIGNVYHALNSNVSFTYDEELETALQSFTELESFPLISRKIH